MDGQGSATWFLESYPLLITDSCCHTNFYDTYPYPQHDMLPPPPRGKLLLELTNLQVVKGRMAPIAGQNNHCLFENEAMNKAF